MSEITISFRNYRHVPKVNTQIRLFIWYYSLNSKTDGKDRKLYFIVYKFY